MHDHPLDPLLVDINQQMGNLGVAAGSHELKFYTHVLAYKIRLDAAKFRIFQFNRMHTDLQWAPVLIFGTMHDVINTLTPRGPFLNPSEVPTFWAGVKEDSYAEEAWDAISFP
jgi:hypothetical protein